MKRKRKRKLPPYIERFGGWREVLFAAGLLLFLALLILLGCIR